MAETSKYGSALELAICGFIGVIIGVVGTGGLMIWLINFD